MSYTPVGRLAKAIVAILEQWPLPDAEVARRVGTSRQRVQQVRKCMGLPMTPTPKSYDAGAVVEMYRGGAGTQEVATRFHVSGRTVLRLLRKAGVAARRPVNRRPSPPWVVRALRTANWRWCNVCLAVKCGTRRLNMEQLRFRLIRQGVIPHHRLPRASVPCRPGCKRAPRAVG